MNHRALTLVREKFAAPELFMLLTWTLLALREKGMASPLLEDQRAILRTGAAFIGFAFVSWVLNLSAVPDGLVGSTVEVLNYLYGFLIMMTIVHVVDRWEVLENCLWAWLAAAFVVSLVGMAAVVGLAPGWAFDDFTGRVSATLKFENQVPSFLLPILPAAVVLAVVRPQKVLRQLFLTAIAFAGIGTMAMTGSRAGLIMVALALVGVLWIAVSESNRPRLNTGLISATFAGLVALQVGISAFALMSYDGNYSLGKTPAWQRPTVTLFDWITDQGAELSEIDATRVIQVGFVLEHFGDYAAFGIGPKMISPRFRVAEIHNTYLGILLETGIIGSILFMKLIVRVFITGRQAVLACDADIERAVIRALLVGMALLLFYQLTMFGLRQRNLWILMGLIIAVPRALAESGLLLQSPAARRSGPARPHARPSPIPADDQQLPLPNRELPLRNRPGTRQRPLDQWL